MNRMPITNEERRRRLERLLDLAQVYRGWTRRELAKSLGRDPTKLIPGSGNEPKFQEVTLGNSSGRQTQVLKGLEPGEKVFIDLPPWPNKRPGD